MLRRAVPRRGGVVDSLMPDWRDRLFNRKSASAKLATIKGENDAFESAIGQHKQWEGILTQYKAVEAGFQPSHNVRKIAVDWRRQVERGTMHYGRWYEGPSKDGPAGKPSDYTPGNTFNRLDNVRAPFSAAEWEERKQHRSYDLMKFGYSMVGIFLAYRLYGDWPVVWVAGAQ